VTEPISPYRSHYDQSALACMPEENECRLPEAKAGHEKKGGSTSSTREHAPHRAAVDKLKAGVGRRAARRQARSCALPVLKSVATCAGAVGAVVAGTTTGPGDIVVAGAAGAACGLEVVEAHDCVAK
jgi:hypothetical protein